MRVDAEHWRSVWADTDQQAVGIIDQTRLPHEFHTLSLRSAEEVFQAIRRMQVRGAPLIGALAAYGVALEMNRDASDQALTQVIRHLADARPTAINLRWALDRMARQLGAMPAGDRSPAAWALAALIADEDVEQNRAIGEHGLRLIREAVKAREPGRTLNILTHCNAGWLATVDLGTATAPIYRAFDEGLPIHVWVDETRPRNQGASLTCWELGRHGVPHTLIADNAGGHLMQHGQVDLCLVGSDRTTASGDVCNKIGTYLKALAAHDNGVPFYVALPSSTIDWSIHDGVREVPIEARSGEEMLTIAGRDPAGAITTVQIAPPGTEAANPAFDVTPARLISGLITERGLCAADAESMAKLFGR